MFARPGRRFGLSTVLVTLVALAGCQSGTVGAPAPTTAGAPTSTVSTSTVSTSTPSTTATSPTSTQTAPAAAGHGQVVVLDPGHNGGNASHPAQINALVPAGRGQRKACNTTGTSTDAGYTEHAFNWDVANRVEAILVAKGYRVIMTRANDTGVGPCVDQRAAIGNDADAAAVVSIHGDGSETVGAHGFHVEYSSPPLNAAQAGPAIMLATALRDAVRAQGFPTANYIGSNGLFGRDDLGGLNLSDRPAVLIECGNMRDAGDAAVLSSTAGRQRIAAGIAAGIIAFVSGRT